MDMFLGDSGVLADLRDALAQGQVLSDLDQCTTVGCGFVASNLVGDLAMAKCRYAAGLFDAAVRHLRAMEPHYARGTAGPRVLAPPRRPDVSSGAPNALSGRPLRRSAEGNAPARIPRKSSPLCLLPSSLGTRTGFGI